MFAFVTFTGINKIMGEAKIMEVELAEPDLLTKYIDDKKIQNSVVRTLSKRIKERADRL